jgi:hypothetical protein
LLPLCKGIIVQLIYTRKKGGKAKAEEKASQMLREVSFIRAIHQRGTLMA